MYKFRPSLVVKTLCRVFVSIISSKFLFTHGLDPSPVCHTDNDHSFLRNEGILFLIKSNSFLTLRARTNCRSFEIALHCKYSATTNRTNNAMS